MNVSFKDSNLWIGLISGALLVFLLKDRPVLLAPSGDPKIAASYMRNGFSNLLMEPERRKQYSICYESFVKERESIKPLTATGQSKEPAPSTETNTEIKTASQLELPAKERVEGSLTYVFHLKENGELIEYELAKDDFKDDKFPKCIQAGFKDLRFLPPPLGINRYIAYEMTFKKDETVRKELEERKSNSPLTLVPTPGGEETKIEGGLENPSTK